MSVTFGSSFVVVTQTWSTFKSLVASKAMAMQYDTDPLGQQYLIFAIDNPIVYSSYIYLGTVPDNVAATYSQAQNDADKSDFETNYKPLCNKPLDVITTISGSQTGSALVGFYGAYVPTAATSLVAMRATTFVEQTSAASRSFSSTNANDNASGSGTRQIRLTYYDNSMNGPFFEDLFLTGTVNVNTRAGNIRFVESIKTLLSGNNGGNVGNINMFAATAGAGGIIAQVAAGDGKTYYAHHYVRPNTTFYLEKMFTNSTVLSGGVSIRYVNPFVINSFEDQVGTTFRSTPTQMGGAYDFADTVQIPGPARVTFYVKPDGTTSTTYFINFGWTEY